MKRTVKNTYFLITVLLLICLIFFVIFYFIKEHGSKVIVEIDGVKSHEFSLSEDIECMIISENNTLQNDDELSVSEGRNLLIIKDGYASVLSADCVNQVCVHSKSISHAGESIICLPHRVHIYIE